MMAQGSRPSRPKAICCRCRRRAEGVSRLTNLGWLCDNCYELLNRSSLGRRLYRMVYQFTGPGANVPLGRPQPAAVEAPVPRPAPEPGGGGGAAAVRDG